MDGLTCIRQELSAPLLRPWDQGFREASVMDYPEGTDQGGPPAPMSPWKCFDGDLGCVVSEGSKSQELVLTSQAC